MGSTGKSKQTEYRIFDNHENPQKWFDDKENSNLVEWALDKLIGKESDAIEAYTGAGYGGINETQYNVPWEDILTDKNPMYVNNPSYAEKIRNRIANIHNGLNKFELKKPIVVTRKADFKVLGLENGNYSVDQIKQAIKDLGGTVQNDGFMSFSADSRGRAIDGSGLQIRLHIPESKGAGAYVAPISMHNGEKEFLVNNNAILKFDTKSVHEDGGLIVVDAYWLGRSESQTISPTNNSKYRKSR